MKNLLSILPRIFCSVIQLCFDEQDELKMSRDSLKSLFLP